MTEAGTKTAESQKRGEGGIATWLKSLGSTATIMVAVFYGVGLLVTNVYLLGIGVTDFNLFRVRCVLTGSWATLMMAAACLPVATLMAIIVSERNPNPHFRITRRTSPVFLIGSIAVGFMLEVLITSIIRISTSSRLVLWYGVDCGVFLLPLAFYSFSYFQKKRIGERPYFASDAAIKFITGVFVVMCVVLSVSHKGRVVYPSVPAAFGGGRPQKAKLILNQEGVIAWNKIPGRDSPLPTPGFVLTPEIDILYENETQIVFTRDKDSIVSLDRKLISAIITSKVDQRERFLQ